MSTTAGPATHPRSGEHARLVPLDAIHNLRDLGGYPTADGRSTRWRTVYRADGLNRLAGPDLEHVRALGLRTVIDLRSTAEVDDHGHFPVTEHPVELHHVPLIDIDWEVDEAPADHESPAPFLFGKYLEILELAEPRLTGLFEVLARPDALPAAFHCAAGKDRTGVVAALLLGALGVPDDVIVADYALTGEAMERMRAWAEVANPSMAQALRNRPSAHLATDPLAMVSFLDHLRERHGSPRQYLRDLGVTASVLAELERALLVDGEGPSVADTTQGS